jgi:hypothetical protein
MLLNEPNNERCRCAGFPAALLARVMKAEGTITCEGFSAEGDFQFSVPMRDIGLSRTAMARPAARTKAVANLIGEMLVRKNIAMFAEMLEKLPPPEYDRRLNAYVHRHFGMTIEEDDRLQFLFHSSLVQRFLIEDLEGIL